MPAGGATDDVALLTLRNLPVPDRFSAEFAAEPESLAPMRSMLRRWLSHAGADDKEIAEITTACGEAATNAIEHAGGRRHALRGRAAATAARSRSPCATAALARRTREGDHGRGLELMRTLMDTVAVEPAAGGNHR